jgi:hypothetical protein
MIYCFILDGKINKILLNGGDAQEQGLITVSKNETVGSKLGFFF